MKTIVRYFRYRAIDREWERFNRREAAMAAFQAHLIEYNNEEEK